MQLAGDSMRLLLRVRYLIRTFSRSWIVAWTESVEASRRRVSKLVRDTSLEYVCG